MGAKIKHNYLKRKILFSKNKIFTYIYEKQEFIIDLHWKCTVGQICTQKGRETNMILKFIEETCSENPWFHGTQLGNAALNVFGNGRSECRSICHRSWLTTFIVIHLHESGLMPPNSRRPQRSKPLFYLTNILCLFRPLFHRACERTAAQTTFHTASEPTESHILSVIPSAPFGHLTSI
jgi:hypothetical protein